METHGERTDTAEQLDNKENKLHRAVPVLTVVQEADSENPGSGGGSLYSLIRKRKHNEPAAAAANEPHRTRPVTPEKRPASIQRVEIEQAKMHQEKAGTKEAAESELVPASGSLVAAMRRKFLAAQTQANTIQSKISVSCVAPSIASIPEVVHTVKQRHQREGNSTNEHSAEEASDAKSLNSVIEPMATAEHSAEEAGAKSLSSVIEPMATAEHSAEEDAGAKSLSSVIEPMATAEHSAEEASDAKSLSSVIEPMAAAEHSAEDAGAKSLSSVIEPMATAEHSAEEAGAKSLSSVNEPMESAEVINAGEKVDEKKQEEQAEKADAAEPVQSLDNVQSTASTEAKEPDAAESEPEAMHDEAYTDNEQLPDGSRQRSDSCGSFDRMLMTEMPTVFGSGRHLLSMAEGGSANQRSPAVLPPPKVAETDARTPENRAIQALKREDISSFQQQQQTPKHDFRSPCKQNVSPSRTPPITIEQYRLSQQALLSQWEEDEAEAPTGVSQLGDEGIAVTGDVKERLDRLEQLIMLEESVLRQAGKARVLCTTPSQSVETSRLLLLAGSRRQHYQAEVGRLKQQLRQLDQPADDAVSIASSASSTGAAAAAAAAAQAIGASFELLATLTVSGLRLSLTLPRLQLQLPRIRHHFACLLLCPEGRLIATEVVSTALPTTAAQTEGPTIALEVPNCVSVNQLRHDFQIQVHVYWMPSADDQPAGGNGSLSVHAASPAAATHMKRRRLLNFSFNTGGGAASRSPSIKSAFKAASASSTATTASASAAATTAEGLTWAASFEQAEAAGFQLVGEASLNLSTVGSGVLALSKPDLASVRSLSACPLLPELALHCQLRHTASPRASLSGYLSWHRLVGELADWARLWTVLTPERLRAWTRPEDSEQGLPCLQSVDLTSCPPGQTVGIAPEEVCVRRHTLCLRLSAASSGGEAGQPLLLLNCESREQRIAWSCGLNAALQQLRNWGPSAGSGDDCK